VTAVVTLYLGGSPVQQVNTTLDHSHAVPFTGLAAETPYEAIVVITDATGNGPTVSAPLAFTTLALPDTDAPLILTGPHISEITATGATVTWTTNEPANSGVSYNDGVAYGVITGEDFVTEHQVTLASLIPETLYNVTVSSTDVRGNGPTLSDVVSFTTLALPDTDAPTIIGSPLVHEVNHQMALIKWQTDERSDSVVLFGTTPSELLYEAAKSSLTTEHTVPVNHLDPATRYYFLVRSTDADGNTAQSEIGSFITRSNDPHDGVEFAVPPYVVGSTDATLTVYWRTHQSADSLLQCTDTSGTISQVADGKRKKEHQLTLTGLLPDEAYNCVVTSADQHGNSAQMDVGDTGTGAASAGKGSQVYAFAASVPILTDAAPDVAAPTVTVAPTLSYVSDRTALINWSTDEPADALIRYWADGNTEHQQVNRSSLALDHQLAFNELQPGTLYHVEIESRDVSGNRLTVTDISFMSDNAADTHPPAFSVMPVLENHAPGKVRITFSSDEPVQAQAYFGPTVTTRDWQQSQDAFATSHVIEIVSLSPESAYFFSIDIIDPAGNRFSSAVLELDGAISGPAPLRGIATLPDLNGNGYTETAVVMGVSNEVQVRDAQTDALLASHGFGTDPILQMAILPDLDSSGRAEIAVLQQQASGQVRVQIRDSLSGNVVRNLFFGANYSATSMQVLDDYNANGASEIAVMGSDDTDAIRVQVQDSGTGTILDNVFLGNQGIGKDFVAVADTSGNGMPELGILSVLKDNDQVRTQLWDAVDSTFLTNVWFGKVYQPQSMITIPDINTNGSEEIVAIGVDPTTQNVRVQVRDSASSATHYNIWLGNTNEAVDIALVNDINGNGYPDLAVLLKTPTGAGRVRVQDGLNGAFIRNLFFSAVENPTGLAVMPDYSGNDFEELAVLGENAGVRHVQILDTSSGTQVNRIDYP
jgi:hypothetical protein